MTPEQFTEHRKTLNMTQAGLADLIGLTRIQINRYENAKSTIPGPVAMLMTILAETELNSQV